MIDIDKLITKTGSLHWRNIQKLSALEINEIVMLTDFLDSNATIKERCYCIISGIDKIPRCKKCKGIIQYKHGYTSYCSLTCSNSATEVKGKRIKTCQDRYGVSNPSLSEEIKLKTVEHNYQKFGVSNPAKDPGIRKKISKGVRDAHELAGDGISNKTKATCQERYGHDSYSGTDVWREKTIATNLKNHGVEWPGQSDIIKDKSVTTCLTRYGSEMYFNSDDFKYKSRATLQDKYGKDIVNPGQVDSVRKKASETMQARYGAPYYTQRDIYASGAIDILNNKERLSELISEYGTVYIAKMLEINLTTIHTYISKLGIQDCIPLTSSYEIMIEEKLKSSGIKYIKHCRKTIPPFELDFVLPELNIAIEFNGVYWHCELVGSRGRNYHYDKWMNCRRLGYDLYTFYDDDVDRSVNFLYSKLEYITKSKKHKTIGARLVELNEVSKEAEFGFLDEYHIQGKLYSRSGALGAYYKGCLVGIMNYALRKNYLEITRFATETEHVYPGLFSRMMKNILRATQYTGDVISFSNNDHSNGNVYRQSGFVNAGILPPTYWYVKENIRENRQKYMKNKIALRFGVDMSDKTEWQAMQELGYDRIWDTGKIKWKYNQR